MLGTDRVGGLDALHVMAGWHPDVGDDGVGLQGRDPLPKLVGSADRVDYDHLAGVREEPTDSLADDEVVLGDHHT